MSSHSSNSRRDVETVLSAVHFEPDTRYRVRLHDRLLASLATGAASEVYTSRLRHLLFVDPVATGQGKASMPHLRPIAVFSMAVLFVTVLVFVGLVLLNPKLPEPVTSNLTPTVVLTPEPSTVRFGDEIELIGCDVRQNGTEWTITFVWKVIEQPETNYSLRIYAVKGLQITTILQGDSETSHGIEAVRLPTSGWAAGGLVQSVHTLAFVPDSPMPPDAIYIGLENAQTEALLPASQEDLLSDKYLVMVWPENPVSFLSDEPSGVPALIAKPDIAATVMASQQPQVESYPSPDGQWRAEIIRYGCTQMTEPGESTYGQLRLVDVASENERIVDDQLISCSGGTSAGNLGLGNLFWSPNSRYFYYTDGAGEVCGKPPLIQLDVTTEKAERLSKLWEVSPDGKTVAMWQRGDDLILWDLDEGETGRIPIMWDPGVDNTSTPKGGICGIAWSPDGLQLAYVESASISSIVTYFVIHVDVSRTEQRLLVRFSDFIFSTIRWETASQIELRGQKLADSAPGWVGGTIRRYWPLEPVNWTLDPVTGELNPAP